MSLTEEEQERMESKRHAKATLIEYLDNVRPGGMDVLSAVIELEDELRELCGK